MIRHFVPSADFSAEGLRELVKNLPPRVECSVLSASQEDLWQQDTSAEMPTPIALPTPQSSPDCVADDVEDTLLVDAMNIPRMCTHLPLFPFPDSGLNTKMLSQS